MNKHSLFLFKSIVLFPSNLILEADLFLQIMHLPLHYSDHDIRHVISMYLRPLNA